MSSSTSSDVAGVIREVWPAANSITELIGETPLIELSGSVPGQGAPIFVKDEGANPSGSVRDRTLLEILDGAAAAGLLRPGDELVMAGATNSALSAALIAGARGYRLTVFHPAEALNHVHELLSASGGEIVLTSAVDGVDGAVRAAAEYAQEATDRIYVDGRRREALVDAINHIAHEILTALDGKPIGAFVTSVSTGSTLRHVAAALRQVYPELIVVGVSIDAPEARAQFYTDISRAFRFTTTRYPAAGYTALSVSEVEAWRQRSAVANLDGLLMGPKGGSAVLGAMRIRDSISPDSAIVALSIDGGHRYLGFEPKELLDKPGAIHEIVVRDPAKT